MSQNVVVEKVEKSLNSQPDSLNSNKNILLGQKTKLTLSNFVFDITLLVNLISNMMTLVNNPSYDYNWYLKFVIIIILFVLEFLHFTLLSVAAHVQNKSISHKLNSLVLIISSFILLFECLKGRIL